jgi:RNA polymerase sigma factor (sigma-70 family)
VWGLARPSHQAVTPHEHHCVTTCSDAPPKTLPDSPDARERLRRRVLATLLRNGRSVEQMLGPQEVVPSDAALATALMDLFRCTGDQEVFDCLVQWVAPQLLVRIRSRLRSLGASHDPQEMLQDAIVNIYRYPDRFNASRPGAFAAWSSTIVDNAIRRHLREQRRRPDTLTRRGDLLHEQPDLLVREPSQQAEDREECAATMGAFALLLQYYLAAFATLTDRERFVLEMVEVRRLRYSELANVLGIRAEALKMVVFRARKRIADRIEGLMGTGLAS